MSALALGMTGCKTQVKEANALAKQASGTGDTLETYYVTLSKQPLVTAQISHVDEPEQTMLNGSVSYTYANLLNRKADLETGASPDSPKHPLADYLKHAARPFDAFFKRCLRPSTLELLAQYSDSSTPSAVLNEAIAADLNTHIDNEGELWYMQLKQPNGELKDIKLSPEAQTLVAQRDALRRLYILDNTPELPATHQRRIDLARWILDSAYPDAIRRTLAESFAAQAREIQTRQAVAHELKSIGDALQNLTGTAASDSVKEAAAKLQTLVEDINHHPLTIASKDPILNNILDSSILNLSPSTLAGRMFETITQIRQESEFRRLLPLVDQFLLQLRQFFDAEQPAYLSISANYYAAVAKRDAAAIDDPTLAIITIDPKTLAPYGIAAEVHPQTTNNGKPEAKVQVEQAAFQNITNAQRELVNISGQLDSLHQAFRRFLVRNKLAPLQSDSAPPVAH